MGWTSQRATHYKWVGKGIKRSYVVDRKAECDAYFMEGLNRGYYDVLKSSMVGSVYYAAVKHLQRYSKDADGNKIIVDIPTNEQQVFGAVFLTSTDIKDHFNFSYKNMDESYGPCYYDCPKGILDLLTPTDNEYANNWRTKCREQLEKKKNPNALSKLPEYTVIKVVLPFDTQRHSKGDEITLTKRKWGRSCKWFVNGSNCYFTAGLMKSLEDDYEVIKRGE